MRSSSSIIPCRFSRSRVRYTVLRSTDSSRVRALRRIWLASRCLVAVSITLRIARRGPVIRIPRSASWVCNRPGISVCGSGICNLPFCNCGRFANNMRRKIVAFVDNSRRGALRLDCNACCDSIANKQMPSTMCSDNDLCGHKEFAHGFQRGKNGMECNAPSSRFRIPLPALQLEQA